MVAQTLKYFYALPGLAGGALVGVVAVKVLISSEEALSQVRKLGTVPLYISGATLFGLAGAVVMTTMR